MKSQNVKKLWNEFEQNAGLINEKVDAFLEVSYTYIKSKYNYKFL